MSLKTWFLSFGQAGGLSTDRTDVATNPLLQTLVGHRTRPPFVMGLTARTINAPVYIAPSPSAYPQVTANMVAGVKTPASAPFQATVQVSNYLSNKLVAQSLSGVTNPYPI